MNDPAKFTENQLRCRHTRCGQHLDDRSVSRQRPFTQKATNGLKSCFATGAITVLALAVWLLAALSTAEATEPARWFLEGISDYQAGHFSEAISKFSKLTGTGVHNGKLFYNLGNAYLKNDELGRAILWYERAAKLIPEDPDLKFNLDYARLLVKDEPAEKITILRVLFFWQHLLSPAVIQWTGIILNTAFWLLWTVQLFTRKKRFKFPGYMLLTLALVFSLTAFYGFYVSTSQKEAIILPDQVAVRSGLKPDSTQLFVLHAGSRVKIEKETPEFVRIQFTEGKIGWIQKADAGLI